jgi:hypothetical protein
MGFAAQMGYAAQGAQDMAGQVELNRLRAQEAERNALLLRQGQQAELNNQRAAQAMQNPSMWQLPQGQGVPNATQSGTFASPAPQANTAPQSIQGPPSYLAGASAQQPAQPAQPQQPITPAQSAPFDYAPAMAAYQQARQGEQAKLDALRNQPAAPMSYGDQIKAMGRVALNTITGYDVPPGETRFTSLPQSLQNPEEQKLQRNIQGYDKGIQEVTRLKDMQAQEQKRTAAGRVTPTGTPTPQDTRRLEQIANSPSPYDPLIQQAAQKYGFDPMLFKRLLVTESRLDPNAKNPSGAVGIGQIMPMNFGGMTEQQMMDPAVNIDTAGRVFRWALEQAQGDPVKAVAFYKGAVQDGRIGGSDTLRGHIQFAVAQPGQGGNITPATGGPVGKALPSNEGTVAPAAAPTLPSGQLPLYSSQYQDPEQQMRLQQMQQIQALAQQYRGDPVALSQLSGQFMQLKLQDQQGQLIRVASAASAGDDQAMNSLAAAWASYAGVPGGVGARTQNGQTLIYNGQGQILAQGATNDVANRLLTTMHSGLRQQQLALQQKLQEINATEGAKGQWALVKEQAQGQWETDKAMVRATIEGDYGLAKVAAEHKFTANQVKAISRDPNSQGDTLLAFNDGRVYRYEPPQTDVKRGIVSPAKFTPVSTVPQ